MEKPKNRIVIQKMNGAEKTIRDYITRKDAVTAFYTICDAKGYNYGMPVYDRVNGVNTQVGMETGGIGHDLRITLHI